MNAATERCGFAANSAPPSIADCLISEPRVWVEMLDADDRPTAALQVSGLPLALKRSPTGLQGEDGSDPGDIAVQIAHAHQGVLVAVPGASCKVRFNGGPHTKLPHEFESWVLIDIQSARFRITNAGFPAQSRQLGTDVAFPRWRAVVDSVQVFARWARRPGMMALGVVVGLSMMALADWLADTSQVTPWTVLLRQRGRLTDLLVWYAGWCALSRMLTGQTRWFAHLRIVALATLAYGVAKLLIPPAFAAVGVAVTDVLRASGWVLLAALAGWAHVAALPAKQAVRRVLGLSVGAVLTLMVAPPVLTHFDNKATDPASAATLPVGVDRPRETPLEQTLKEVAALQAAADRARAEPFK